MKRAILAFIMLLATVGSSTAWAQDLDEIKQRMKNRIEEIARLKAAHIVGENRKGFLEIVKMPQNSMAEVGMASDAITAVVKAENKDRKTVYAALAEQVGTDVEQVGRLRADQIYKDAKPGVLLKTKDGRWVTKSKASG